MVPSQNLRSILTCSSSDRHRCVHNDIKIKQYTSTITVWRCSLKEGVFSSLSTM